MKRLLPLLLVSTALMGCASSNTAKRFDAIDGVTVDQMVGNRIAPRPFTRDLVCLNARREIKSANGQAEHFLYTEIISTTGFVPAAGESLVLSIDGERFGFSPTNSATAFVARRGYETTLYKASPEVFVKIANAKDVRLRLKGNAQVIEKHFSRTNIQRFRDYLVQYYQSSPKAQQAAVRTANEKQ